VRGCDAALPKLLADFLFVLFSGHFPASLSIASIRYSHISTSLNNGSERERKFRDVHIYVSDRVPLCVNCALAGDMSCEC